MSVNNKSCYLFEQERLSSFKYWKFSDNSACNKFALAAAGFYKFNPKKDGGDDCACFYCGKELDGWDAEDDPFKEHKSHSQKCKFINLERRESELKVKDFIELLETWWMNHMNKMMENEIEQRSKVFHDIYSLIEAKYGK